MCLFVGLSVRFLSATRHLSTLRRCLREQESRSRRRERPRAPRGQAHAQRREHGRACRTTSQRKNRCADAFQKTKPYARAHAVVYVTAEIFKKKGKKKTNMPLPKFSLQFAFYWSAYFSNRTESYSSQIEFAGPHGIICNFTFSYLILSKTIGRKRLRTQSLVGADLGQLVYIYIYNGERERVLDHARLAGQV